MHVMGAESTYPQALGHRLLLYTPQFSKDPSQEDCLGETEWGAAPRWPDGSRTTVSLFLTLCHCCPHPCLALEYSQLQTSRSELWEEKCQILLPAGGQGEAGCSEQWGYKARAWEVLL